MFTFYTNPMSRGRIVHWMLEEVGAKYETKALSFEKREQKTPEFLKINPMGKLPAMVHDGVVITEAAAIVTYLADRFPEKKLIPAASDPLRGSFYRWMFFGASCVESAVIDKMLQRPPVEKTGALGYGTYHDTMTTLEGVLKNSPYILGNQFSAADLYLSSELGWAMMMKTVEPTATFTQYVGRCTDRPAYRKTEELCQKLSEQLKG